jgi:hypothetical protein
VIVIGRAETRARQGRATGEKRTATRIIVDNHGTIGAALPTPTRNPRPTPSKGTEEAAQGSIVRTRQPAAAGG